MGVHEAAMQMVEPITADAMGGRREGPTNEQIEKAQKAHRFKRQLVVEY
jgi:hypothetical protein